MREVKNMPTCNCQFRCSCVIAAVVVSVILGVIAAFLQITGTITVTPAFLWVVLGVAIGYLGILLFTANRERSGCCAALGTVLAGILGAALFAVVLLAVGITATSVVSAILVGLLVLFAALTVAGTACLVRCATGCSA